nr:MAG TPA: hypothetical protein [Caudoviricetes sp.]
MVELLISSCGLPFFSFHIIHPFFHLMSPFKCYPVSMMFKERSRAHAIHKR